MWLLVKGVCLDLPVGLLTPVCVPSVCPELILHDFKCSFCSRDGLDNIHSCGRFLCNFSVPPAGSFDHFLIYLNLFFLYTENIQAGCRLTWLLEKSRSSFHFCSRPPCFGCNIQALQFCFTHRNNPTKAGKAHIFSLFYPVSSRTHLFCFFLSLVSVPPISSLPTGARELLIKAEGVIILQEKNGSFCLCEVWKLPN